MIQKSISLKNLAFGKGFINPETIFLHRSNIIAIVAPNSLIEGHVWICSRRSALKLDQLTEKEALDLWMTANEVSRKLEETLYKVYISKKAILINSFRKDVKYLCMMG